MNWRARIASLAAVMSAGAFASCSDAGAPEPPRVRVPLCNAATDGCCLNTDADLCVVGPGLPDASAEEDSAALVDSSFIPACNANPDPCCGRPDGACFGADAAESGVSTAAALVPR